MGSETRVCGGQGDWEGPEPECVQARCPVPRIPLHGDQEIQSLLVGGAVLYRSVLSRIIKFEDQISTEYI